MISVMLGLRTGLRKVIYVHSVYTSISENTFSDSINLLGKNLNHLLMDLISFDNEKALKSRIFYGK